MTSLSELENIRPEVREEFMHFIKLHDIEAIQDLLKYKDEDLLEMEGFGMRLLVEVNKLRQVSQGLND